MGTRTSSIAATWLAAALVCTGAAHAGELRGEIKLDTKNLGAPPARNQGFLERIENPLRAIAPFNPYPYLIVVLDGQVDDEARRAPGGTVRYRLLGESFELPILPVVAQTRVEVENRGPKPVVLLTPDDPELLDSVTVNSRSYHEFKVTKAEEPITIRSQDSVHLIGHVVAFPHRYFATVDSRGRFQIDNVPDGTWKVKLWYRGGWLEGVEQSVEVKRRGDVTLTVAAAKLKGKAEK